MTYPFPHDSEGERERLARLEASADPGTVQCLESLGITEGWRCLEVGAGRGSIAEWLCHRVAPSGTVVATDLETKFLKAIDVPNLEVRQHDIAADELEHSAFDLVHARKVLEWLADPDAALERMAAALRPGGWLVVEDPDHFSLSHVSGIDPDRFRHGYAKFHEAMTSSGFNPTLGIHLTDKLRGVGLIDVGLSGSSGEWTGDPSGWLMVFRRFRDQVVELGLLSAEEADRFLDDIRTPEFRAITAIHFRAWGRRPGGSPSTATGPPSPRP